MRILFDVRELERNKFSGIGRFILSVLKNKDYFNDFEFILVGNKKTDFDNSVLNGCDRFIINDIIPVFSEQLSLHNLVNRIKPDLYLSPYYKYPILIDIPVVTAIFDLTYLRVQPYKNMLWNSFYIKNFIKYFTSKSNFIITSSQNTKKDILSFFKMKEEKIKVIYLPLDNSFKPQEEGKVKTKLSEYGIKNDYILHVGNNSYHKNIKALYNAYKLLPQNIRDKYDLVLVGFRDINNEYPLAKVLSYVDDVSLKCLYSGATLFVFPSLYEGFGYPPLEAMSSGCPVLASHNSSIVEVLGDFALYFNPDNIMEIVSKIEALINNSEMRKEMGLKGLKRASFFSYEKFLSEIEMVFNEVLRK